MKRFAIVLGILLAATAIWGYNVLRADQEPVTATPSPAQLGRQKLHDQLVQSEQREAEIEQQDWNSVTLLRALVTAHEQRILKLTGNSEAGEILAHDRDAVTRLQKRIDDLVAAESAPPAIPSTGTPAGSGTNSEAPAAGGRSAGASPQLER